MKFFIWLRFYFYLRRKCWGEELDRGFLVYILFILLYCFLRFEFLLVDFLKDVFLGILFFGLKMRMI